MSQPMTILCCRCAQAGLSPPAAVDDVLDGLSTADAVVEVVDDLCGLAARGDPLLARSAEAASAGRLGVAACFPRTVRWLFHAAAAPLPADGVTFANLRTEPPEAVLDRLLDGLDGARARRMRHANVKSAIRSPQSEIGNDPSSSIQHPSSSIQHPASGNHISGAGDGPARGHPSSGPPDSPAWVPWFPVIDYSRCKDCGQCLNFCLFGVYSGDGSGRARVTAPARCKTNCPACARMCPDAAIIFPKYSNAPINGDEVTAENLSREDMDADLLGRLGERGLEALRERGRQAALAAERGRQRGTQQAPYRPDEAAAGGGGARPLMSLPTAEALPPQVLQVHQSARKRAESDRKGGA